jgi:LysR family glycine cleavage system transcriptional activator
MRKLPPLNSIRMFESAARHQSVSVAGEELCVTHGAVSKQIKQLEAWLNTRLFEQSGRRIRLTDAGQRLYRHTSLVLDSLADACAQIADSRGRTFRIHATPTLAMRWLLPRLTNFQARQPAIKLSLSTGSDGNPDLADVILERDGRTTETPLAHPFMAERETPMCTEAYRAELGIHRVEDLQRACWLNSDLRAGSWEEWLQLTAVPTLQPAKWIRFGQYYLALQAALDGLGVFLGSLTLVADDLASGRLVPLFPGVTLERHAYTVLVRQDRTGDPVADDFVAWLMEEAPGQLRP